MVLFASDVDVFEVVEEGGTLIPVHVLGLVDDVVAIERGNGNGFDVDDVAKAGSEGFVFFDDFVEPFLGVVHEVHFVNGEDDVLDTKEVGDEGVTLSLLNNAFTGINEDNG